MRALAVLRVTFFLLSLCAALRLARADLHESNVLVLNDDTFDAELQRRDLVLVEFYAPWCGICKRLAPEWERAADILQRDGVGVTLAKVDCTQETGLAKRFKVNGYPTIKLFKHGKEAGSYEGARTADAIADHARRLLAPLVVELKAREDVAAFRNSDDVVLIAYFPDDEPHEEWANAARQFRESNAKMRFGRVVSSLAQSIFDEECPPGIKARKALPAVIMYRRADPNSFSDDEHLVQAFFFGGKDGDLADWAKANQLPLFTRYDKLSFDRDFPVIFVFLDPPVDSAHNAPVSREIYNAAKEARRKGHNVRFAWEDRTTWSGERLGIDPARGYPALAMSELNKLNRHYAYPDQGAAITAAGLLEWIGRYVKGDLPLTRISQKREEAFLVTWDNARGQQERSRRIDPPADGSPLKEIRLVVLDDFEREVMQAQEDVLVLFHSPHCGKSLKFYPVFRNLMSLLAKEGDLKLVMADGWANDFPSWLDVVGMPDVRLFLKGRKDSPLRYEGSDSEEELAQWAASHRGRSDRASEASADARQGNLKDEL